MEFAKDIFVTITFAPDVYDNISFTSPRLAKILLDSKGNYRYGIGSANIGRTFKIGV
jgi:hypothetical protein